MEKGVVYTMNKIKDLVSELKSEGVPSFFIVAAMAQVLSDISKDADQENK